MKTISICILVCVVITGAVSLVQSAGPSDQMARSAFKQILSEADKNKDGKLSMAECKAMFKDPAAGDKKCSFWDANHDGIITEDEYASQAMNIGKKK